MSNMAYPKYPIKLLVELPEKVDINGFGINRSVFINQAQLDPKESIHVLDLDPNGFNWGYHGKGPKQLAYAILRVYMTRRWALRYYEVFMFSVIGSLEPTNFHVEVNLHEFFNKLNNGSKTPYTDTVKVLPIVAFEEIATSNLNSMLPVTGTTRNMELDRSKEVIINTNKTKEESNE